MGLYTTDFLDDRNIKELFFQQLGEVIEPAWWNKLATPVDSDRELEEYKWLGQVPTMREWIGGRQEVNLNKFSLEIRNKRFESTLPLTKNDRRRDKTNQLAVRTGDLAQRAATFPNSLVSTLAQDGEAGNSGLAYDGQFFYDTDHDESGTDQTNDLTNTEVPSADVSDAGAPTATEAANIIVETIGHMKSFTDDQGEPMNQDAMSFIIMVSKSTYWAAFQNALAQNNLASAVTNPVLGLQAVGMNFSVILNTRLTAANEINVFRTDSRLLPFILQEEEAVQAQMIGAGSEEEFKNDRWLFGVTWRGNAGYGDWRKAALVKLS